MKMPKKCPPVLTLFFFAALIAACGEKNTSETESYGDSSVSASADPLLAKVGETEIRQSQLDVLIGRLDAPMAAVLNVELEEKMLQSLVRARALAIVAERNMNAEEKVQIEARVQAFRDELLAQHYLQNQVVPRPVTTDQVKQYYETHLEEYTIPGRVEFEYLSTGAGSRLEEEARKKVIGALATANEQRNWRTYAETLQSRKLPVEFKSAQLQPHLVAEPLRSHVQTLVAGETSDLVYGEQIYIVRVVSRGEDLVRPLHEVSAEIRKKLAPMQLKQALSESAQQVLQEIKVEIIK
jgi:hypothetical protein